MSAVSSESKRKHAIDVAIRTAKIHPGQQLPNGATIIQQREVRTRPHGVEFEVLAVATGFQPYVIWTRMIGVEDRGADRGVAQFEAIDYTFNGHYHRDLRDALADWRDDLVADPLAGPGEVSVEERASAYDVVVDGVTVFTSHLNQKLGLGHARAWDVADAFAKGFRRGAGIDQPADQGIEA